MSSIQPWASPARPVITELVANGVVSILTPVGAVVTDTGHTFAVEAVNVLSVPVRLRCTRCPWQAPATGLPSISDQVGRHGAAHDLDDSRSGRTPRGWLVRLTGGAR